MIPHPRQPRLHGFTTSFYYLQGRLPCPSLPPPPSRHKRAFAPSRLHGKAAVLVELLLELIKKRTPLRLIRLCLEFGRCCLFFTARLLHTDSTGVRGAHTCAHKRQRDTTQKRKAWIWPWEMEIDNVQEEAADVETDDTDQGRTHTHKENRHATTGKQTQEITLISDGCRAAMRGQSSPL